MPPSKVCPQCETIVHARLKVCKSCEHVFRAKRKAEHNLPDKAMKRMRVSQSDSVKSAMKAKNKLQNASKRASETSQQTLHRQEHNRKHMASMRADETSQQTVHRKEQGRNHKASMRATASDVSVQQAIMSFHSDIKNGPDYVCTCCHRLMYSLCHVTQQNIPSAATTC